MCSARMEEGYSETKSFDSMGNPLAIPTVITWWDCPECSMACVVTSNGLGSHPVWYTKRKIGQYSGLVDDRAMRAR
ncbi:hypothetical protein E2P64_06460 [Candidatus Bathyarchaeota archaeon]|nr:hypothetical protein E2P64_06460 [Candidatus Bathyarchaeota archaeon]